MSAHCASVVRKRVIGNNNYCLLMNKLNGRIWCVTGLLPWNAVPGKACGMTLSAVCKTREVKKKKDMIFCDWSSRVLTMTPNLLPSVPNDLQPLRRCLRRRGHHRPGSGEWSTFQLSLRGLSFVVLSLVCPLLTCVLILPVSSCTSLADLYCVHHL